MSMLSVGRISEGFVLDHIQAGKSMEIYKYLNLDKLDCTVAILIWMCWASSTIISPSIS